MIRKNVRRATLATAASTLVFVAGCAGNPEPEVTDTATASPAATSAAPRPSRTPTSSPTQALDTQLLAATTAFYEAVNNSYKTLDVGPVRDLITPQCSACKNYIESVEATKDDGNSYTDVGKYLVEDFAVAKNTTGVDEHQTVTFRLTYTGFTEVDGQGKPVRKVSKLSRDALMVFNQRDGRWLVVEQEIG